MRKAALLGVHQLARADDRVVFIGSDITKQNLEAFAEEFPERFFMEGIYEAHIIGMAAGMALAGKVPYINTIATFLTRRCYEQIVIDLGLHDLPVRLLGSGGGVVYAPLGPTHLATDDIAIMRTIPNMTVVAPCDADEMERLLPATLDWPHPIYIRIAKGGDRIVSSDEHEFAIGRAITLRDGGDVLLVSTGITTQVALEAADELAADGIAASVLHVHTVKPLDAERIVEAAARTRAVVTIEEHVLAGGLGSAVAEALVDAGAAGVPLARLGFPDVFLDELGSQAQIMAHHGLTAANVA
ncbi:MAG: transketolase, partial [Actinobacteria bacterium]|nr:transketolase [Actinomycetota bacterium]